MMEVDHADVKSDLKSEEPRIQASFFHNKFINHLVTINNAFKWSEDNQLSIITNNSVFIFDFVPSPMQAVPILTLLQTHINCPETTPNDVYAEEIETRIFDWSSKDIRSFLMRPTFTPNFQHALKASFNIADVFWSPQDLLSPSKCLLAILTSHGTVELVVLIKHYWISVHEFSTAWIETVKADLQALSENDLNCDVLRNQLERLQATSVAWGPLRTEQNHTPFAYLTIGHRNSEIVVWKVHQVTIDAISVDRSMSVEMKFKKKVLIENVKINTMLWIPLNEGHYILLIGFFDGQFGSLKLQEFEGGITCTPYVGNHDADSSPVHDLQILRQRDCNVEIIVIKEKHICLLTLNGAGEAIDKKFILVPGFSITGVSLLNFSTVLVATQEGNLCLVRKTDRGNLVWEAIDTDITKNDVQYLGLASSKNRALHAVITSPRYLYDHLVVRDPSCINFFYLENSSMMDPLNTLYQETDLSKFWDCLELVKIIALKYNQQPKLPSGLAINFESMPLHKLKVMYWVMMINETYKKKYFPHEQSELLEDIELCKLNIFLRSALNHLSTLIHKDNLSDFQKLCINVMVKHFDSYLSTNEISSDSSLIEPIKKITSSASKLGLPVEEKCNLCDEIITEPRAPSCPAGHLLTRCALTRLQVTCVKFRSCMVCQEIFHPSLDTEMKQVRCLYCNLPVLYKIRNIDPAIVSLKENLSKKVQIAGNKDSKDDCGD